MVRIINIFLRRLLQPHRALSFIQLLVALTVLTLFSTAGLKTFQSTKTSLSMAAPAWSRPNGMKQLLLSSIMILPIKLCRQQPHHVCMSTTRCQMICKPPKSWQLRLYLERAAGFSLPRQNADCRGELSDAG